MSQNEPAQDTPKQPHLTRQVRDELLAWLERGLPIETAAQLAGTTDSTVRVWRAKSRQRGVGGNLHGFDDAVVRALALGESVLLAQVRTAGKQNWRAAAWLLERMYPEKYAPPSGDSLNVPAHSDASAPTDTQAGL